MNINKTKLHYRTLCVGRCTVSFWSVVGAADSRGGCCSYLTSQSSFWNGSVLSGKSCFRKPPCSLKPGLPPTSTTPPTPPLGYGESPLPAEQLLEPSSPESTQVQGAGDPVVPQFSTRNPLGGSSDLSRAKHRIST